MHENGTINMERIDELTEIIEEYSPRTNFDSYFVNLNNVYQKCSEEIEPNENTCEAASNIRNCVIKEKSEWGVDALTPSIWL